MGISRNVPRLALRSARFGTRGAARALPSVGARHSPPRTGSALGRPRALGLLFSSVNAALPGSETAPNCTQARTSAPSSLHHSLQRVCRMRLTLVTHCTVFDCFSQGAPNKNCEPVRDHFLKLEGTLSRRKTKWFCSRLMTPAAELAMAQSASDHVGHAHAASWTTMTYAVWSCWSLVYASTTAVSGL